MKKVLLIVRDGWGHGKDYKGNAITGGNTPNHDFYTKNFPTVVIKCTGNDVGNPKGVQGGSEVGHLTMGAGRIVWQPYELINRKIKSGEFLENEVLLGAIRNCEAKSRHFRAEFWQGICYVKCFLGTVHFRIVISYWHVSII